MRRRQFLEHIRVLLLGAMVSPMVPILGRLPEPGYTFITRFTQKNGQSFDMDRFRDYLNSRVSPDDFSTLKDQYASSGRLLSYEKSVFGNTFEARYVFRDLAAKYDFFSEIAAKRRGLQAESCDLYDIQVIA